jgi:hypothetical protein
MDRAKEAAIGRAMLNFEKLQWTLKKRGPLPTQPVEPEPVKPCADVKRLVSILERRGPLDVAAITLHMRQPALSVRGLVQKGVRFGLLNKLKVKSYRTCLYEVKRHER